MGSDSGSPEFSVYSRDASMMNNNKTRLSERNQSIKSIDSSHSNKFYFKNESFKQNESDLLSF